jgi:endonuclease/exonuclease/phosphatase family metal-dependent hydrolase
MVRCDFSLPKKGSLVKELHRYILLFVVIFTSAFAQDEGTTIRVASYNIRNYLSMDRIVEGKWRPDYPKPEKEKSVVRETILSVRPDILALQEIGSQMHLEELRRDLSNQGLEFKGSAWLEAHDSERHVAALWRSNLEVDVVNHINLPIKYMGKVDFVKRGMLELKISGKQGTWSLFNLHLKSKYTNFKSDPLSTLRRTLEGRAARDKIIKRFPELERERFLIVGDLNDSPVSGAVRALTKKGSRILSIPIECVDANESRWTHYYKKEDSYTRIDYLLRSPGWTELSDVTGQIFNRPDYYEGSDHRMIWVDLPSP